MSEHRSEQRPINLEAALRYPFQKDYWRDTILIPGILFYINLILSIVLMLVLLIVLAIVYSAYFHFSFDELGKLIDKMPSYELPFLTIMLLGYQWHLYDCWQREGIGALPPSWEKDWRSLILDGLKASVFYIATYGCLILGLTLMVVAGGFAIYGANASGDWMYDAGGPIFAVVFSFIFIMIILVHFFFIHPVLTVPLIITAREKRLVDLFDIGKALRMVIGNYPRVFIGALFNLLFIVLYILAAIFLFCSCVGIFLLPFLAGISVVVEAHLWAQVFDTRPPEPVSQVPLIQEA